MSNRILGLGTAVPDHCISQEDALTMSTSLICEDELQRRFLRVLFRNAGVDRRHTIIPWQEGYRWKETPSGDQQGRGPSTGERMRLYQQHAPPLALKAVQRALASAEVNADRVTHLVTVSCTGFGAPGIDLCLFQSLPLAPTVERVHVGFMGCHGAINGLRVARGLAAANPDAVILLCAVEICSLHYLMHWDPEGVKGNALFSDGAAAVIIGSQSQDKSQASWEIAATGSCVIPDSSEEMSWIIGDHGFEMRLTSRVPVLINQYVKPWLTAWLERQGYSREDIGSWAIHPGGPRILDAAQQTLELPVDACQGSRDVLRNYGNMSSPTVLFIFDRIRMTETRPIVLLGFGPGLTAEVALLRQSSNAE